MVLNVSNTFKKSIDKRRIGTTRGISYKPAVDHAEEDSERK
jgi:hypothetical protein